MRTEKVPFSCVAPFVSNERLSLVENPSTEGAGVGLLVTAVNVLTPAVLGQKGLGNELLITVLTFKLLDTNSMQVLITKRIFTLTY